MTRNEFIAATSKDLWVRGGTHIDKVIEMAVMLANRLESHRAAPWQPSPDTENKEQK